MIGFIGSFLVGVVCVAIGISNMRGNISSLHSYHRNRVSEEDRIPFGRKVGLGTLIIGCGIMVYSVLATATLMTDREIFSSIGNVVMTASMVVGLGIAVWAMKKYNKGVF